jgi:hypothetical protein
VFSELLLDLVDRWPKTVKIRNREPRPFLAKTLLITSSMTPEEACTAGYSKKTTTLTSC